MPREKQAESLSIAATSTSSPAPKPAEKVSTGSEKSKSWYQRNWLVISLLILFPFAGIPLAWMSQWPRKNKIGASTASGLWLLLSFLTQPFPETQPRVTQENPQMPTAKLTVEESQVDELPESIVMDPEEFFSAAQDGDLSVVKAMLAAGVSPDTTNKAGNSALSIAASSNNLDVVKAIVAAGPSKATKDSALNESTLGTVEVTTFLLGNGADARYTYLGELDGEKRSVLYTAARFGTPEHVKALLAAGASWDQLNQQQANDALRGASCGGWPFTVKELLAIGADPNNMNVFEDESPLILASSEACRMRGPGGQGIAPGSRQHDQVIQLLKAAGAK